MGDGYAENRTNRQLMHRMVIQAKNGDIVDHINGDKLDNRKSNLRVVNIAQSNRNRSGKKNSSSQYKGVSWCNKRKCWVVHIKAGNVRKAAAGFKDEIAAAKMYNKFAKELHGDYARLNRV